jgi:hypothetical protein
MLMDRTPLFAHRISLKVHRLLFKGAPNERTIGRTRDQNVINSTNAPPNRVAMLLARQSVKETDLTKDMGLGVTQDSSSHPSVDEASFLEARRTDSPQATCIACYRFG